jgi:hypothetical protein
MAGCYRRGVRRHSTVLAILVATGLLAGCDALSGPGGAPYPASCGSFEFSERRCAGIVARARQTAADQLTSEPVAIGLLHQEDGTAQLGGYQVARVVFTLPDGSRVVEPVMCIGVPDGPGDAACWEPFISVQSAVSHDVPCAGEPPDGCATPIALDPEAVAAARPMQLPAFDVPLDHLGHYEIEVGEVGLPNGYIDELRAAVAEERPADFWIDEPIRLEVRPKDPSRPPFGDVYARGRTDGVEDATVWLVFDVTEASPGAVLHLVDIDVR